MSQGQRIRDWGSKSDSDKGNGRCKEKNSTWEAWYNKCLLGTQQPPPTAISTVPSLMQLTLTATNRANASVIDVTPVAQRGQMTCPRSHSYYMVELELKPDISCSQSSWFWWLCYMQIIIHYVGGMKTLGKEDWVGGQKMGTVGRGQADRAIWATWMV